MKLIFSDEARRRNEERVAAILDHPFNRELAAGNLERECFCFYLAQDAHYLLSFARALEIAADRAPSVMARAVLLRLAREGIEGERQLHESFGVDPSIAAGAACTAYGDFLLATVTGGTIGETLAALLPCYSVYAEVAGVIAGSSTPDNPYARWIATYDGDAFSRDTDDIARLTNTASDQADEVLRAAMYEAYGYSVRHELLFLEAAYRHRD